MFIGAFGDVREINFDDYPEKNYGYLKKLIKQSVNTDYWDETVLEQASVDGVGWIKFLKINILVETFILYGKSSDNSSVECLDKKFTSHMNEAYFRSCNITDIFMFFKFLPDKDDIGWLYISENWEGYLPDSLPCWHLNHLNDFLYTEDKKLKLEYFSDLLLANFKITSDEKKANYYISSYCHSGIEINWINYCIIDSFLSKVIYEKIMYQYKSPNPNFPKNEQRREYYYQVRKGPFSQMMTSFKRRDGEIYKWVSLPTISFLFLFNNMTFLSGLTLWAFITQLIISYNIKKNKKIINDFVDSFSSNILILVKLKKGLGNSVMSVDYIKNVLINVNEDEMFELDNLISFISCLKNKFINPINRITSTIHKIIIDLDTED